VQSLAAKLDRLVALQRAAPKKRWRGYEEFRKILGPEQLAVVDDDAALIAVCKGRRAGGTTAFIGKTLRTFDRWSYGRVLYFAPSDEQGVDILWEDLQQYNRDFDLQLEPHWSDRYWSLGARRLDIIGFHGRDDVDRVRGQKARLVGIDEAQLGPDWFERKVKESIMPTTLDYLGQVVAMGTPSEVAAGFFFDAFHAPDGWSNDHTWTCAQNPFFLRQGRDPLREARERFNLSENSVTYRREWLALWEVDPDALVYYVPDAAVRTVGKAQAWWGNVIGLDLGWKDHDAIGIVGVEALRQWSHLRHMETKGQQTNHELFRRITVLAEKFPGPNGGKPAVVYDPAGHATRKTIETFRIDAPQIVWVQADKQRKVEFIDWLNNDLREGTTTVETDCSMVKEALRLRWKRPGKVAEDADHSDQGDAWLYAWRHSRDYLRKLSKKAKGEYDPFDEHMRKVAKPDGRNGYFADRLRGLK